MLHLMKYRLKQTMREKSSMFWALCFPLILATLFRFTLGDGSFDEAFQEIPVALVVTSEGDESFRKFLDAMDGDMLKIKEMSEEKALEQLAAGKLEGIYYDTKELAVSSNSIRSSILDSILDTYVKNEAMVLDIASEHPERLPEVMEAMRGFASTTEEVSAGGRSLDTGLSFFFALMAMACLYGCFPGLQVMQETRANLAALGARQCISPTHKLKRILAVSTVTYAIQFVNTAIALFYIRFVLKMDFGGNMAGMLLICLMGSLIGVSMGIVVGCISKIGEGVKVGIVLAISMISCGLAGLFSADIKVLAEEAVPWLGRVNPASVIADAFYCLNVYNDKVRYTKCLITLAAMSMVLVLAGFLFTRRERYDSI
ncbi:ABC transporter permease [Roseburia hominis]